MPIAQNRLLLGMILKQTPIGQLTALDFKRNIKLSHLWSFGNPMSETEMESLISTLRNVAGGELWLSIEPLGEAMHASAAEKGWTVQ